MVMPQKQNETVRLIWSVPHRPFIRSDQSSKRQRSASLPEQMCLRTKQRCEIRSEALAFSEQHKWLGDFKKQN